MKELWIVGKSLSDNEKSEWEFAGVFDSKDLAIAACIDKNYFIGSVKLNETIPHETVEWKDAYYPLGK
ncbi:hypothetical protein ES704_03657 [subsurface metagenome]|jgi:hypothetical protein